MIFRIYFISLIAFSTWNDAFCQFGKAVISEFDYHIEDSYFSHNESVSREIGEFYDATLKIERAKDQIKIFNKYNDGYFAHKISITLDSSLNIIEVNFDEWSDDFDGSISTYEVEKIILNLSNNPFMEKSTSGYYTLQIREDYHAGSLKSEGVSDTTYHKVFEGKFKVHSEQK